MTGRNRGATLLALSLLLLAGCAAPPQDTGKSVLGVREWPHILTTPLYNVELTEPVGKACYDHLHDTLYLLQPQSNTIAVYVGGKRANTLGGLGYGATQFSRLSDIALGADGVLLALDSFKAHIKRFDHNGDLVSVFDLDDLTDPRLLAAAPNGNLYVWDAARRDITIITDPPADEPYTFGRFQLEQPSLLMCNSRFLWAWDGDFTIFFSLMGNQLEVHPLKTHLTNKDHWVSLFDNTIHAAPNKIVSLTPTPPNGFWVQGRYMMLSWTDHLQLTRFDYATP